ncbi:hypothetical protein BDI4_190046 [Burkholderia diffusa]|nr:hypothetical protein BDI4_190046 [Burkholderia diffusa]
MRDIDSIKFCGVLHMAIKSIALVFLATYSIPASVNGLSFAKMVFTPNFLI